MIERNLGHQECGSRRDLDYWRTKTFASGMSLVVMMAIPFTLVGSVVSYLSGMVTLAVIDLIIAFPLVVAALAPRVPKAVRQGVIIAIFYLSSWFLVWFLGQASVWYGQVFLITPVVAAFIWSPAIAYRLIGVNVALCVGFAVVLAVGVPRSPAAAQHDVVSWLMLTIGTAAVSVSVVRMIESVVHLGLQTALDAELEVSAELVDKNAVLSRMTEELDYQRSDLAAIIRASVHTLNEPLIVAGGYASVLGEDLSDSERAVYSSMVIDELEYIQSMIMRYGAYGRLSVSEQHEVVTPRQVLDPLIAGHPEIVFDRVGDHVGAAALGSHRDLLVMMEELVTNPRVHNDEAAPPTVQVVSAVEDRRWTITVTDDGVGIDEANLATVFELFSRAGQRGSRSVGLGLAVARKVAHNHGGTISVSSVPGVRTQFVVTVPLIADASSADERGRGPVRPLPSVIASLPRL